MGGGRAQAYRLILTIWCQTALMIDFFLEESPIKIKKRFLISPLHKFNNRTKVTVVSSNTWWQTIKDLMQGWFKLQKFTKTSSFFNRDGLYLWVLGSQLWEQKAINRLTILDLIPQQSEKA